MSHTTETIHVRGVRRARLLRAIVERMSRLGFTPVPPEQRSRIEGSERNLRRLALRRDKKWLTLADSGGFDRRHEERVRDASIEAWGQYLSRALDRSVLTIWTWDGEAAVRATRWKRGKRRGVVSLLGDAYRGADGLPYAPAKIFWPWLPPARRSAILARGIPLVTPAGEGTGDPELDALLEGFDDADLAESAPEDDDGDLVFVEERIAVAGLGGAVGMRNPFLDPWDPADEDEELLFERQARKGSA
jgi:hypothetical protein